MLKKEVKMEEVEIKYPLARQDQLMQQLPSFRIIKQGARKRGVERFYQSKDKKTNVKIQMFKELDIADQDLLLTILAMALPVSRGNVLSAESKNHQELWQKLKADGIFASWETLRIETTFYELNKELNKARTKTSYKWIDESLERLLGTNIIIETEKYKGGSNFVSYHIDKETKRIHIAINPVSALVLIGDNKGFILHNRKERLSLKKTPSRALYSILVGLVNIHNSRTISILVLIEKMHLANWGEKNKDQRKMLKRSFKSAITEINTLNLWTIKDNENDTITINRK